MALKRRNRVEATFAMSSMTDLVFLLLLFFVMASTMSSPNDIKINLPTSHSQHATRPLVAKVFIDANGGYSVAKGNEKPVRLEQPEALAAYLSEIQAQDATMSVALHADEAVDFSKVVYVLDVVNERHMKLVIATKKP
ncbi:MAG: biopolymer transporter ExbD [Paludibacteraceae bacterium]|nr:biopolymer transporter ExbD [Paludibacteraceae bacterium]